MLQPLHHTFHAAPRYQPILREVGLDAEAVYTDPRIKVWRKLPERENATLDATLADGRPLRLHIKRHQPTRGALTPAEVEARGIRALQEAHIPTVPLVGWGRMTDGRSFLITEDLTGHQALDQLLGQGLRFDVVLEATADLAAALHNANLHHRDLYLCHFFAVSSDPAGTLKLIDAARVRDLPRWWLRSRWLVKDLAQFWYSTSRLDVSDEQRTRWLMRYVATRTAGGHKLPSVTTLRRRIERKAAWIARHDAKLNAAQPQRNISISH
jgi:heptose I phosphotransferase